VADATADPRPRCGWAGDDARYVAYHDTEWGVPLTDGARLFELLCLEGAQAGLAWITILRRRDGYRAAFEGWDPGRVAAYGEEDVARLLADTRIVRNRAKVRSAIANARAFLAMADGGEPFAGYLWKRVGGAPVQNAWTTLAEVPAETELSRAISADLRRRGFSFVGPTIVYAFLQSAGIVNDHLVGCFRHAEVRRLAEAGIGRTT
jgi:DNA-3-methyladenine glycosylase I